MNYNYNNYGNPYMYNQMSANKYAQPNQQAVYNNYQQPQNIAMPQYQQTNYLPLTFVNGVEGAKAFIVNPNQTIYLKDSDSNLLFEKRADSQGKYSLVGYKLEEISINDINKTTNESTEVVNKFATKDEVKEFAKLGDLNALETLFDSKLDKLSSRIEKLARQNFSKGNVKEGE